MLLAWHVDYWDKLRVRGRDGKITSWKDPFSMAAATQRQERYRQVAGGRNKWTPQFVVDNAITRNARGIAETVAKAAGVRPKLAISVETAAGAAKIGATVKVASLIEDWTPGAGVVVRAVLYRKKVATKVTGGENQGKTLHEYFVVTALHAPLDLAKAMKKGVTAGFARPEGVPLADLGVAVLVEDTSAMKTLECLAAPVK